MPTCCQLPTEPVGFLAVLALLQVKHAFWRRSWFIMERKQEAQLSFFLHTPVLWWLVLARVVVPLPVQSHRALSWKWLDNGSEVWELENAIPWGLWEGRSQYPLLGISPCWWGLLQQGAGATTLRHCRGFPSSRPLRGQNVIQQHNSGASCVHTFSVLAVHTHVHNESAHRRTGLQRAEAENSDGPPASSWHTCARCIYQVVCISVCIQRLGLGDYPVICDLWCPQTLLCCNLPVCRR